jgi:hypothetical protein
MGGQDREVETADIDQTICTITLCHRDFDSWSPPAAKASAEDEVRCFEFSFSQFINVVMLQVTYDALATDLTLIYCHRRSSDGV